MLPHSGVKWPITKNMKYAGWITLSCFLYFHSISCTTDSLMTNDIIFSSSPITVAEYKVFLNSEIEGNVIRGWTVAKIKPNNDDQDKLNFSTGKLYVNRVTVTDTVENTVLPNSFRLTDYNVKIKFDTPLNSSRYYNVKISYRILLKNDPILGNHIVYNTDNETTYSYVAMLHRSVEEDIMVAMKHSLSVGADYQCIILVNQNDRLMALDNDNSKTLFISNIRDSTLKKKNQKQHMFKFSPEEQFSIVITNNTMTSECIGSFEITYRDGLQIEKSTILKTMLQISKTTRATNKNLCSCCKEKIFLPLSAEGCVTKFGIYSEACIFQEGNNDYPIDILLNLISHDFENINITMDEKCQFIADLSAEYFKQAKNECNIVCKQKLQSVLDANNCTEETLFSSHENVKVLERSENSNAIRLKDLKESIEDEVVLDALTRIKRIKSPSLIQKKQINNYYYSSIRKENMRFKRDLNDHNNRDVNEPEKNTLYKNIVNDEWNLNNQNSVVHTEDNNLQNTSSLLHDNEKHESLIDHIKVYNNSDNEEENINVTTIEQIRDISEGKDSLDSIIGITEDITENYENIDHYKDNITTMDITQISESSTSVNNGSVPNNVSYISFFLENYVTSGLIIDNFSETTNENVTLNSNTRPSIIENPISGINVSKYENETYQYISLYTTEVNPFVILNSTEDLNKEVELNMEDNKPSTENVSSIVNENVTDSDSDAKKLSQSFFHNDYNLTSTEELSILFSNIVLATPESDIINIDVKHSSSIPLDETLVTSEINKYNESYQNYLNSYSVDFKTEPEEELSTTSKEYNSDLHWDTETNHTQNGELDIPTGYTQSNPNTTLLFIENYTRVKNNYIKDSDTIFINNTENISLENNNGTVDNNITTYTTSPVMINTPSNIQEVNITSVYNSYINFTEASTNNTIVMKNNNVAKLEDSGNISKLSETTDNKKLRNKWGFFEINSTNIDIDSTSDINKTFVATTTEPNGHMEVNSIFKNFATNKVNSIQNVTTDATVKTNEQEYIFKIEDGKLVQEVNNSVIDVNGLYEVAARTTTETFTLNTETIIEQEPEWNTPDKNISHMKSEEVIQDTILTALEKTAEIDDNTDIGNKYISTHSITRSDAETGKSSTELTTFDLSDTYENTEYYKDNTENNISSSYHLKYNDSTSYNLLQQQLFQKQELIDKNEAELDKIKTSSLADIIRYDNKYLKSYLPIENNDYSDEDEDEIINSKVGSSLEEIVKSSNKMNLFERTKMSEEIIKSDANEDYEVDPPIFNLDNMNLSVDNIFDEDYTDPKHLTIRINNTMNTTGTSIEVELPLTTIPTNTDLTDGEYNISYTSISATTNTMISQHNNYEHYSASYQESKPTDNTKLINTLSDEKCDKCVNNTNSLVSGIIMNTLPDNPTTSTTLVDNKFTKSLSNLGPKSVNEDEQKKTSFQSPKFGQTKQWPTQQTQSLETTNNDSIIVQNDIINHLNQEIIFMGKVIQENDSIVTTTQHEISITNSTKNNLYFEDKLDILETPLNNNYKSISGSYSSYKTPFLSSDQNYYNSQYSTSSNLPLALSTTPFSDFMSSVKLTEHEPTLLHNTVSSVLSKTKYNDQRSSVESMPSNEYKTPTLPLISSFNMTSLSPNSIFSSTLTVATNDLNHNTEIMDAEELVITIGTPRPNFASLSKSPFLLDWRDETNDSDFLSDYDDDQYDYLEDLNFNNESFTSKPLIFTSTSLGMMTNYTVSNNSKIENSYIELIEKTRENRTSLTEKMDLHSTSNITISSKIENNSQGVNGSFSLVHYTSKDENQITTTEVISGLDNVEKISVPYSSFSVSQYENTTTGILFYILTVCLLISIY